MIKRFALRETLNSNEACELISTMIQAGFTETDLLAYCTEGHVTPYIKVRSKQVRSAEFVVCAQALATQDFVASGFHQVATPDLIGMPGLHCVSFSGTARAIFNPNESSDPNVDYDPWHTIEWAEDCSVELKDLWFFKRQLESIAGEISGARDRSLDTRTEKGIGQTIAAVAALAAKGGLDLDGDVPFRQAQELHDKGEIEFTIGRDTFKKYFSMGRNHVIAGYRKSAKIKPTR